MRIRKLTLLVIMSTAVVLMAPASGLGAGLTDIEVSQTPGKHEVRYVSGRTVYIESLLNGRWVGCYWGAEGPALAVNENWDNDAFELRIKDAPTPPTMPGRLLSMGWKWVSASELSRTDRGARHFVVELSNTLFPVKVKVHTLLDGTPVLTRYLEISNTSSKSLALTSLSPWAGRLWSQGASITLGHSLRWQQFWEGWFGWTRLSPGTNSVEESRGLASDDPYFILHNDSRGEYFFGELAWPANYLMEFQNVAGLTFKIGPTAINALRVIRPGELIKTPSVHLGFIKGDFDQAVQGMHDHIRRSVLLENNPERSYRTQYLIPEDWPITVYRGDEYNETNMKKCMDVAAEVGLEVFILDGPMWMSTYGDWLVPSAQRFPNGLGPLVDYAHRKGLLFGLYAEPEGGRDGARSVDSNATVRPWKDSKVFQEHPDWFNRSVLNLSIPAAASYFQSALDLIVDHYQLDLYRHDFNAPLRREGTETVRDGFVESDYWRHYDALYGAFRHIHAKHPDLILQQAANGGTRTELATAAVFHEQFTSDRATMPWMFRMLAGMSVYMPPESLVNSNGMALPDMPKDNPNMDPSIRGANQPDLDTTLRGAFALANTPMIFNYILPKSVEELKPEIREKYLHYAHIYKTFMRPVLPTCKVYHFAPVNATGGVESGNWFAMEFAAPDKQKAWAVIIRLARTELGSYDLRLKGLDSQRKYRVTFDNTGDTKSLEGASLMQTGLAIQPGMARESELLLLEQE